MKSKISFFNAGIFKSMLKRFWPLWAAYFASWFVSFPLVTLVQRMQDGLSSPYYLSSLQELFYGEIISSFILAILVAMAMFSFLYSSRSTGLIASMPVRREAVFCSAYLAGLLPIVAANLLIAALNFVFTLGAHASTAIILKANLMWLAGNTMYFVIFYGIAVFIAMMTSNIVALPVLYIIFNFLFLGMEQVVRVIFGQFVFGFADTTAHTLEFLSPIIFLFGRVNMDFITSGTIDGGIDEVIEIAFNGLSYVLIYFAVGIALSVLALLFYRKHRMETSGDVVSVPRMYPVFKYGVAVCAAICFGLFFYVILTAVFASSLFKVFALIVGMIIGAFIGYFASEMLLKKSFHVFHGNWVGFVVLALCCAVFAFCCDLDVFGIAKNLPDAEDVECIVYADEALSITDSSDIEKLIEVNKTIIDDRDKYADLDNTDYESIEYIDIRYILKDGGTIARSYTITNDENYKAFCDVINSPDNVLKRFIPSIEVKEQNIYSAYFHLTADGIRFDDKGNITSVQDENYADCFDFELSPKQAVDFYYNALIPDIKAGAKMIVGSEFNNKFGSNVYAEVSFDFLALQKQSNGKTEEIYDSMYITIDPECTHCIQWIKDNLDIDLAQMFK